MIIAVLQQIFIWWNSSLSGASLQLQSFLWKKPSAFDSSIRKEVGSICISITLYIMVYSNFSHTESPAGMSSHLLHHGSAAMDTPLHSQQKLRCEASAQEFDSTRFLYQLVVRCYECLSLWKLICEYQIHLTISGLSKVRSCDHHVIGKF